MKTLVLILALVQGTATWYEWHAGEAAAGPALRQALGPHWRGQTVKVCAGSCVVVKLTDWCACGHGRVIDLDDQSFRKLAPLSQGVVKVTVTPTKAAPARPSGPNCAIPRL